MKKRRFRIITFKLLFLLVLGGNAHPQEHRISYEEIPIVPIAPGPTEEETERRLLGATRNVMKIAIKSKLQASIDDLYHAEKPQSCGSLVGNPPAHQSLPLTQENIQNGPYPNEFKNREQTRLEQNRLPPSVNRQAYDPESLTSDLTEELNRYERCGGIIHPGLEHPSRTWSESVRRNPPTGTRFYLSLPKLLPALARGDISRFFPTGHEASLKSWIEEQPDESISPASLFAQMLRLSRGDIYLSLLTIENVLSENWICKNREASSWLKKVVPLGKQWLGHQTPGTDQFGAWYHFFGLVLVGYAYGGSTGFLAGSIEADVDFIGKLFHHGKSPVDPQETFIGKHSGYVGGALRRETLRRGEVASPSCASDSSRDLKANLEQSSSITCLSTSPAQ